MDEKQTARKTRALKLFLLFLAAMLILTFVSRSIYTDRLPRVTCVNLKRTALNHDILCSGMIETQQEQPVIALSGLRIAAVCVQQGDVVDTGTPLLQFDQTYLRDYIKTLSDQIAVDTLTRADYSASGAANSAKIMTFSIEANQKKLDSYQKLLDGGAVLASESKGMITAVNVTTGDFTSESASFLLAPVSEKLCFTGTLSKQESQLLFPGDSVLLSFRGGKIALPDCKIKSITATEDTDLYRVKVPLDATNVQIGETGTITTSVMSSQQYDCVPASAIHRNGDQAYIFILEAQDGFLGKEYHTVKRNVEIADENPKYAGLTNAGLQPEDLIVCDATQDLFGGELVRLTD